MTLSLEGFSTKAKEAPSPHEVRLALLDTNPVFQCLWEKIRVHQMSVHQNYFHRQVCTNIYGTFNIIFLYNFIQSAIQTKNDRCHERKSEPLVEEYRRTNSKPK